MEATEPKQTGTGVHVRAAAARLSERAAEARAGREETTLERLIVKASPATATVSTTTRAEPSPPRRRHPTPRSRKPR